MINEQGTLAFLAYTHLQLAQSEIRDEELCESSKNLLLYEKVNLSSKIKAINMIFYDNVLKG